MARIDLGSPVRWRLRRLGWEPEELAVVSATADPRRIPASARHRAVALARAAATRHRILDWLDTGLDAARCIELADLGVSPRQALTVHPTVDVTGHAVAYLRHGLREEAAIRLAVRDRPLREAEWRGAEATLAEAVSWQHLGVDADEAAACAVDPVFLRRDVDPAQWPVAGRLALVGVPQTEIRAWCESDLASLVRWAATGLRLEAARAWAHVGFGPEVAAAWAAHRFVAGDAAWFEHFDDPATARRWAAAEFAPSDAALLERAWVEPDVAARWRHAGASVDETVVWARHADDPDEARRMEATGLPPVDAADWYRRIGDVGLVWVFLDHGVDLPGAELLARAIDHRRVASWLDEDLPVDEVLAWDREGLGPDERRAWRDAGVDDPQRARVLAALLVDPWTRAHVAQLRDGSAERWIRHFADPVAAIEFSRAGIEPEVAAAWHAAGLGVDVAVAWANAAPRLERDVIDLRDTAGLDHVPIDLVDPALDRDRDADPDPGSEFGVPASHEDDDHDHAGAVVVDEQVRRRCDRCGRDAWGPPPRAVDPDRRWMRPPFVCRACLRTDVLDLTDTPDDALRGRDRTDDGDDPTPA